MVNHCGKWIYKQNTSEAKKCDCDRIADWILESNYKPKTSIENLVLNIILYFDCDDNYGGEYGTEFTIEGCKQYVIDSGGFAEFDYVP